MKVWVMRLHDVGYVFATEAQALLFASGESTRYGAKYICDGNGFVAEKPTIDFWRSIGAL